MSRGEVHAAVLAFLDQFIERGAAPDIVSFRDRLASDPNTGAQLDDALPGDSPSEREAFDAMRTFFESQAGSPPESSSGPPGLWELSWWTAWGRTLAGDLGDITRIEMSVEVECRSNRCMAHQGQRYPGRGKLGGSASTAPD